MARTLTLRDVPNPVVQALRDRARRNHRSMQKEILSILQSAVVDRAALAERLAALRSRAGAGMTLAEIEASIDEGRP